MTVKGRRSQDGCIILFVKYPEPGKVKQRLTPPLPSEVASELYRNFILDHLITLGRLSVTLRIYFTPASSEQQFRTLLGEERSLLPQEGADLGERMKNAFLDVFSEGFERAVLMGSDLPDLPGRIIRDALLSLDTYGSVVGPSQDGGYYLIGFRKSTFTPEAFDSMPWSTDTVLESTLYILDQHHRTVYMLEYWNDIDTFENLKSLLHRSANSTFAHSHTMRYLDRFRDTFPYW
jgi:rSAM/selenodomain-associated transferase 1